MRWRGGRKSDNIEDRRNQSRRQAAGGSLGLLMLMKVIKSKFGLTGVLLLSAGLYFLGGQDIGQIFSLVTGQNQQTQQVETPLTESESERHWRSLVSVVLAQTEDVWKQQLAPLNIQYREPTLVLYRGSTHTACGRGLAAVGPFYCPADEKVYLDLGFLDELKKLGGGGDFAAAYVIAHEIGHHVQKVSGIEKKMRQQQQQNPNQKNALSVKLELQADCYAGIWAHAVNLQHPGMISATDIERGIRTAEAIGDDNLQQRAGKIVRPDSFTHGSAKQRAHWLQVGLEKGSVAACNTF
ncbi:hypothetical protein EDC56_1478 [Sinobacterium caligoides]|uniref:Metalloprotease n=1 Tax=Sinobacterium caligoides TaxID=933926 RepID=A0A3N2DMM3_9GAMM|nr:neutral zinc metallopeptidase [Sinobacterium caligoides]ROS01054.1 hypothetical protein EDC56_1478 [Sinobacterium caligoides]